ncbi:MAG: YraN family protein [Chloroflexi bacterium]|nr:YraN family protein [Chloroflexota bacterium]
MPSLRTKLGDWGEEQAVRFLENNGYRIETTNYRCAYGEVDIVAIDGEEIVFVEVRTRRPGNFGTPEEDCWSLIVFP